MEATHQPSLLEVQRGIQSAEIRRGLSRAHVYNLEGDLVAARLAVFHTIALAGISIRFAKLSPTAISFLGESGAFASLRSALAPLNVEVTVQDDCAMVEVAAVNIRDEEGLLAQVLARAFASGIQILHIGDSHDRVFFVVHEADAERLKAALDAAKEVRHAD
ncbi:MAG: hypothetical protein JST35_07660 [Armatimonadetes bacterium]|nr:hypothetical protein [Armatimonadota bacterium]